MLDLPRLEALRLHKRPLGQVLVAELVLRLDYALPRPTRIVLEGLEHIPRDRGVFLAMNHTDRFNYWPLQYQMYRAGVPRFTASWVKGKYYENRWIGAFLDRTNNIPLPSRGYLLTVAFREHHGRVPSEPEYRVLRAHIDGETSVEDALAQGGHAVKALLTQGGPADAFQARFNARFARMMAEVTRLTRQALQDLDLNVLVFPQGTRSRRLSRGHGGMMQVAQHLGTPIVPIGCNGSDRAYPGGSPLSKGRIVYRIGAPLELDGPELGAHRVEAPFTPFSRAASDSHGPAFQAATDIVMDRINDLLDPEYRFAEDQESDGVSAVKRFV